MLGFDDYALKSYRKESGSSIHHTKDNKVTLWAKKLIFQCYFLKHIV